MPIKNFYTVKPDELEPGDVLVCTVVLHIQHYRGEDNKLRYRMYRCHYPHPQANEQGVPQGSRIDGEFETAFDLFPVIGYAKMVPDLS